MAILSHATPRGKTERAPTMVAGRWVLLVPGLGRRGAAGGFARWTDRTPLTPKLLLL
jgi:hypothetical protein